MKELNLTRRYKLILGNLSIILRQRMPLPNDLSEPEPIYTWYYADIRRYSFSKQMREFAIYCGRNCPTPEKIICFRVKTDLVQLLQVVNEKTGGAFEAELASIKVKKRVCVVSWWRIMKVYRVLVLNCVQLRITIQVLMCLFSLCLVYTYIINQRFTISGTRKTGCGLNKLTVHII